MTDSNKDLVILIFSISSSFCSNVIYIFKEPFARMDVIFSNLEALASNRWPVKGGMSLRNGIIMHNYTLTLTPTLSHSVYITSRIVMPFRGSFRRSCQFSFRKLIQPFTLTSDKVVQFHCHFFTIFFGGFFFEFFPPCC